MKKRFVILNSLILISALIIFLVVSVVIVSNTNTRNMESEIKNYLSIAKEEYDGTNMKNCADNLHQANTKIRVTFISSDGEVLYDTSEISEDNHLSRPEINNLGQVTHRLSNTTGEKMFYVAAFINNVYIRVSMPETSITDMSYTLLWSGFATIVIISLVSFFAITAMSNKAVEPLKDEISKLSLIVGDAREYSGNDIEKLSFQIDQVRDLIEEKIESIEGERKKIDYIIENVNQGIVIINGSGNIIIINKVACNIFGKNKEDALDKSYLYSFLNKNISDTIEECINKDDSKSIGFVNGEKEYIINISSLKNSFVKYNNKYGVALFIYDVTENKRLEKMKTDFFANASHELKSPLTSIIGYQQMIEEGILEDKEEIADATHKTIKEATRMNQIITEMLELSKLESDKHEDKLNLSVAKATDDILNSYSGIIEKKNIKITKLYTDFEANIANNDLYHLLRNLIDNSIKYNKENGEIIIKIDADTKSFEIADTGVGIPNEHIDRIFERFYRVDKAKSKENGGTGLGLAIVKHICKNNDLTINVSSKVNEGTKFTVKF